MAQHFPQRRLSFIGLASNIQHAAHVIPTAVQICFSGKILCRSFRKLNVTLAFYSNAHGVHEHERPVDSCGAFPSQAHESPNTDG